MKAKIAIGVAVGVLAVAVWSLWAFGKALEGFQDPYSWED